MDTQQTPPIPPIDEMNSIWHWLWKMAYNQGLPILLLVVAVSIQQTQISKLSDKVDECQNGRIEDLKQTKMQYNGKE